MHRFAPYFPFGHRPENNISVFPFHPLRACPDVLTLSSYAVPGSESFARTLSEAIAGLLGVFTAEMPGLRHCQLHIQAGSQATQITGASPASRSGGCLLPWLSPFILGPGACIPCVSWQGLAWSSAHLRTGSSVAHSQLARTRGGRGAGQEGPSAISASQLLPSFPYPVPTLP